MTSDIDQQASATAGFAYGVVGADVHRHGDGSPVYLLLDLVARREADHGWLRELPSRMLNAAFGVVDFVGRDSELGELRAWRRTGPRLRARLVHGPGGQGKSRLAARFAEEAADSGWQVVSAIPGAGALSPAASTRDLRAGDSGGLLVLVDYADRWPISHLAMLLANSLLHRSARPVRLLLLGRSDTVWPSILAELDRVGAEGTERKLAHLPEYGSDRSTMFHTARRCFAAVYGVTELEAIGAPIAMDDDSESGLTLALHIAALVAVDAYVTGVQPPSDVEGLTVYLLEFDRLIWPHLVGLIWPHLVAVSGWCDGLIWPHFPDTPGCL